MRVCVCGGGGKDNVKKRPHIPMTPGRLYRVFGGRASATHREVSLSEPPRAVTLLAFIYPSNFATDGEMLGKKISVIQTMLRVLYEQRRTEDARQKVHICDSY